MRPWDNQNPLFEQNLFRTSERLWANMQRVAFLQRAEDLGRWFMPHVAQLGASNISTVKQQLFCSNRKLLQSIAKLLPTSAKLYLLANPRDQISKRLDISKLRARSVFYHM